MDFSEIIALLKKCAGTTAQKQKYVKFIAEKSGNCCEKCRALDGKIFAVNDPDKPALPLHPNCRCRLIDVEEDKRQKREKAKKVIKTIPKAVQTGAEAGLMPTGFGETLGAVQVATILTTDINFRAIKARNTIANADQLDDYSRGLRFGDIGSALAKKDLRGILILDNQHKKKKK